MEGNTKNAESFGMMDGTYFVSKGVILDWMNELLKLQLTKIEQCATGAVHCQILDCLYPNTVKINKVNWRAKHDYEFVENFKIL